MKKGVLLLLSVCLWVQPAAAATVYDILSHPKEQTEPAESRQPAVTEPLPPVEDSSTNPELPAVIHEGGPEMDSDAPAHLPAEEAPDDPVHIPANEPAEDAENVPSSRDRLDGLPDGDGRYATAGDLYQAWQMSSGENRDSPYPSYVCGVWSSDGGMENLTVAVTKDEAGEAGKEEILSQIADTDTVAFTYQSYPYAQLWAIQLELEQNMGGETGVYTLGIDEMENCVDIGIDPQAPGSQAFMLECQEKYGDQISFETMNGPISTATAEERFDRGGGDFGLWPWALACGGLILLGCAWSLKSRAALTTAGHTVSSAPPSWRETEEYVRRSAEQPRPVVLQNILKELDQQN